MLAVEFRAPIPRSKQMSASMSIKNMRRFQDVLQMTYSLPSRCNSNSMVEAVQADRFIISKSELEQTANPAGHLDDVESCRFSTGVDDLL
jgi:hypothetical protein